jgi:hypothetical protein
MDPMVQRESDTLGDSYVDGVMGGELVKQMGDAGPFEKTTTAVQ